MKTIIHHWYINAPDDRLRDHGESVWAIILDSSNEFLWDGWHRFHSYIRKNLQAIPAVLPIDSDENSLNEGKSIKLDNGRRVIQHPTKSDIKQIITNTPMLRGVVLEELGEPVVYIWSGRTMSHYTGFNEIMRNNNAYSDFIAWFKIGLTPEDIQEDKNWRDERIYDCDGYYVAFSAMGHDGSSAISKALKLPVFFNSNITKIVV